MLGKLTTWQGFSFYLMEHKLFTAFMFWLKELRPRDMNATAERTPHGSGRAGFLTRGCFLQPRAVCTLACCLQVLLEMLKN